MIPTSVTSSSPPIACLGSIGNQIINSPTITGCAKASNVAGATGSGQGQGQEHGQGNNNNGAFLGIASLILEGRALADDEYSTQISSRFELKTSFSGNSVECGRQSPKPSTSRAAAFVDNISSGMSASTFSIELANYFGRKTSNSPESTSSSFIREYYSSSSSESPSSSVESNHSRWSQKLSQLRQESPNAHHQAMAARQKVAVECPRGSEAEYVALAINTDHHHFGMNEDRKSGDFEILRRMSINQMNFYNSPNSVVGVGGNSSSGGGGGGGSSSENFMCSLQSLASNTCLRVGSPLLLSTTTPTKFLSSKQISSSTPRYATTPQQQQQQQQLDYSIGSTSSSGISGGIAVDTWYSSSYPHISNTINSNCSSNKDYLLRKSSAIPAPRTANNKIINSPIPSYNLHTNIFGRHNPNSVTATTTTALSSNSSATASRNQTSYPQQGPHCDQFLKKMGLAKGEASETEEHHCDMSYVNITCTRWRAYCIKMENILIRGEPICIEVYLGPVGDKILLEQWIITQNEKQPPPTMTLPSLCSAIRSQLYFSQISAWCDLIKKSDKTIHDTGRLIYTTPPTTSAAGDLATTMNNAITTATTATSTTSTHHPTAMTTLCATSPSAGSGNIICGGVAVVGCAKRRPTSSRLNIFYRIKQYDNSIACFNSKPNVHNFPNVNISENCSVSVCLKSLPRIAGGIPKVGAPQQQQQQQNIPSSGLTATPPVNSTTPTCLAAKNKTASSPTTSKATAISAANSNVEAVVAVNAALNVNTIISNANKSTILKMNCDNNLKQHQQQQQQKQKPFTASTPSSFSHCSFSQNKRNFKQSSVEDDFDFDYDEDLQDIELEYYEEDEHNIESSAGGDDTNDIFGGSGIMGAASVGDCDSSNSSFSTNNSGNYLSHREKQLLKYRKRMLKRDKKHQLLKTSDINQTPNQLQSETETRNVNSKMEQGEDDTDDNVDNAVNNNNDDGNNSDIAAEHSERRDYSVSSLGKGQRQQLPNNRNSIPCTNELQLLQLQQQQQHQHLHHHVKMISTGTQTITNTCTSCGSEKSMICLKCNPLKGNNAADNAIAITTVSNSSSYNYEEIMEAETTSSAASSLSSSDIIHTPRNKAELLLQAIQRTPKSNKKHKHKSKDSNQMAAIKYQQQQKSPPTTITTIVHSNNNRIRNSPHVDSNSMKDSSGNNISHSNNRNNSIINNGVIINNSSNNSSSNNMMVSCQMCKRQKTQHNFTQPTNEELLTSDDNHSLANNSINSSCGKVIISSAVTKNINQNNVSTGDGKTSDEDDNDDDNEKDGGKTLSSFDCKENDNNLIVIDGDHTKNSSCRYFNENETMEEEYFDTSTKLTPHIDRCRLNINSPSCYPQILNSSTVASSNGTDRIPYQTRSCSTPPLEDQTIKTPAEGITVTPQFKTPTPSEQHKKAMKTQQPLQPHKHTPKPNLLHIACNFNKADEQQISHLSHNNSMNNNSFSSHHYPLLLRRSLPKVNLTSIFCNPNSMMAVSSSPIPIGNGVCNGTSNDLAIKSTDINITEASPTFSFESPSSPAPSATVQKSNSAPTLPNSPSLSPRFIKASAIYKRRSRHLSDRSDRSSLGSDEQLSDEDIDSGMYSPFVASPVKLKTRLAAVFGCKPLLGNLEECLLQRRLVPKVEVMGFKLLLGASGGFCPTQLTIPAAAYFYELKGETLSTPYLCEIRLPRKGYTVPRCGTVQATLLNPMGTVVRMFVIPYDMRDMPTLHQTFIRQRILADTGMQNNNGVTEQFNDVDNMSSTINKKQNFETEKQLLHQQHQSTSQQQQRSPQCNKEHQLGHFISAENMKSLRYSIHLRFQTSRTGRLMLHTDIRLLISRRTDCDTAAAHTKGILEAPNELITNTVMPTNPKYSARQDQTTSKI